MTKFSALVIDTMHKWINELTLPHIKKNKSGEDKFDNCVLEDIIPNTEGERVTTCKLHELDLEVLRTCLPDVLIIDDVYIDGKLVEKKDDWEYICNHLLREVLTYSSGADVFYVHLHK